MPNIFAAFVGEKSLYLNGKIISSGGAVTTESGSFGLYAAFGDAPEAQISANILKKYSDELKKHNVTFSKFIQFYANEVKTEIGKVNGLAAVDFAILDIQSGSTHIYAMGNAEVYVLRNGRLTLLTSGNIDSNNQKLHASVFETEESDNFIVCGGGFPVSMSPAEIADIAANNSNIDEIAAALSIAARKHGGLGSVVVLQATNENSERKALQAVLAGTKSRKERTPSQQRAAKRAVVFGALLAVLLLMNHFVFDLFGFRNTDAEATLQPPVENETEIPPTYPNGQLSDLNEPHGETTAQPNDVEPTPIENGQDDEPIEPGNGTTYNEAEHTPGEYDYTPSINGTQPYEPTTPDYEPEPPATTQQPVVYFHEGDEPGSTWYVIGYRVNFRLGPSNTAPTVFTFLMPGREVTFLGRVNGTYNGYPSSWIRVVLLGVTGYIHANLVSPVYPYTQEDEYDYTSENAYNDVQQNEYDSETAPHYDEAFYAETPVNEDIYDANETGTDDEHTDLNHDEDMEHAYG